MFKWEKNTMERDASYAIFKVANLGLFIGCDSDYWVIWM